MAFGNTPKDNNNTPVSSGYAPGTGFLAAQSSTNATTDASGNQSSPLNLNIAQIGSIATSMGGSDAVTATTVLQILNGFYNGTSVDQLRGNLNNITLLNATGVTTSQVSADQTNYNGRGIIVVLDMTTVGTGSVTLTIQGKDPVIGKYYTLLTGAAITTISTNVYYVYPGISETANVSASRPIPRTWRVSVAANNANATTYLVAVSINV